MHQTRCHSIVFDVDGTLVPAFDKTGGATPAVLSLTLAMRSGTTEPVNNWAMISFLSKRGLIAAINRR